jgi:HSP20 family protein
MRNIVNFSPWAELNRMWDLMDRINPIQDSVASTSMPVDMYEQDGHLIVRASLPGVKPEDASVTLDQGVLTISGEATNEFEHKENSRVVHREHTFGSFVRSVRLPDNIEESGIEAHFENWILSISIPEVRAPEQRPKQIPIRHANPKSLTTEKVPVEKKTSQPTPSK